MPKRIAMTSLNGRTIDILNVIRQNASMQYQNTVPAVTKEADIPVVGEHIVGYPANANEFINALLNRIALVQIKSSLFNNPYTDLKKGYLTFGETVEEVFVEMAKAREFSVEKAEAREFKRTVPDVRSAFHLMNWRVQYPITIQREDLNRAFLSADGVTNFIANLIDSTYRAADYDEYLLFKYLIIKAVNKGEMYPIAYDNSDIHNAAVAFRGYSNQLTFIDTKFNVAGVHTNTLKKDQYIFMDSHFNAQYDVGVLASAFNMDKADFQGRLKLIDSFSTFDNDRFDVIRENSNMVEEVTASELENMQNIVAVLVDKEWFQVYDNLMEMSDTRVSTGLYWNYNLNVWKTVSSSPFSNALVFTHGTSGYLPVEVSLAVSSVISSTPFTNDDDGSTIITFENLGDINIEFIQTPELTQAGIAVQKYGAVILPPNYDPETSHHKIKFKATSGNVVDTYTSNNDISPELNVNTGFLFTKDHD